MRQRLAGTIHFAATNLEAVIWMLALLILAFSQIPEGNHLIICPFRLAGFEHCPGCGIGTSIILLLHGQLAESVYMHPLGIPAVIILIGRIASLIKQSTQSYNFAN